MDALEGEVEEHRAPLVVCSDQLAGLLCEQLGRVEAGSLCGHRLVITQVIARELTRGVLRSPADMFCIT